MAPFFVYIPLICLTALAKTSNTILSKSRESILVLFLRNERFSGFFFFAFGMLHVGCRFVVYRFMLLLVLASLQL